MERIKQLESWEQINNNEWIEDYLRTYHFGNYYYIYDKEDMFRYDYFEDRQLSYNDIKNLINQIEKKNIKHGDVFWISMDLKVFTDLEIINEWNKKINFEDLNDYIKD